MSNFEVVKSVGNKKFVAKKYFILIAVSFLIVAIDQLTKMMIHGSYDLGESTKIINNFFNFTYVRNTGAAFGFLNNAQETFRQIFFLTIPPVAVFIIIVFLNSLPETEKLEIYALSAISGGAIGNYLDRLRFGYVIDFLDFHIYNKYTWPAFNIADSAIVIGVLILTLLMFLHKNPSENAETKGNELKQKAHT